MKNTENVIFEGYPKRMLCWNNLEENAHETIVLCHVFKNSNGSPYKVLDLDNIVSSYKYAKDLPKTTPRTIQDGLEQGDIIVRSNGDKRKIFGTIGEIVFVSRIGYFNRATDNFTLTELIENGYQLYQEPELIKEEVEMTVAEISKLVGKTVKVVE